MAGPGKHWAVCWGVLKGGDQTCSEDSSASSSWSHETAYFVYKNLVSENEQVSHVTNIHSKYITEQ